MPGGCVPHLHRAPGPRVRRRRALFLPWWWGPRASSPPLRTRRPLPHRSSSTSAHMPDFWRKKSASVFVHGRYSKSTLINGEDRDYAQEGAEVLHGQEAVTRTKLSEELRSRTIRKSCDKVEIKVTHGGRTPCRKVIATGFAKSSASVEIRKEIGIKTV
uniref:Uncharacterized protein n=1 Tax=Oryza nivara TaxID=4536 RepID=A0A0E0HD63_ORYNI